MRGKHAIGRRVYQQGIRIVRCGAREAAGCEADAISPGSFLSSRFPQMDEAPAPLVWRGVCLRVRQGRGRRRLRRWVLRGVAGEARVGRLCCVLGPSGCGKTSLLGAYVCVAPEGVRAPTMLSRILEPTPQLLNARICIISLTKERTDAALSCLPDSLTD